MSRRKSPKDSKLEDQQRRWAEANARLPRVFRTSEQAGSELGQSLDGQLNPFFHELLVVAMAAHSKILCDAVYEVVRLGLTGQDYHYRLNEIEQQVEQRNQRMFDIALVQLALGSSEREAGREIAAALGGHASFERATDAGRKFIAEAAAPTSDDHPVMPLLGLVLDVPLAERRGHLKAVRSVLDLGDDALTRDEAEVVLMGCMKCLHDVDDEGLGRLISERLEYGKPSRPRARIKINAEARARLLGLPKAAE